MANIKSAIKRIRQTATHNLRNKEAKSRFRTYGKKVMDAIESGNLQEAQSALREASSVLAVTARKGVIHKKQASRRVSRLNAMVKAMALASSTSTTTS